MKGWVALVVATSTVIGFTYAGHASIAPLIASEMGLDDVQLGMLSAALFLGAALPVVIAGDVADRAPKAANTLALALVLAGNVGFALAPTYELLLVARVVGGVGAGFGLLAGLRYISRRYGDARSHFAYGLYGAGFPLGSAIALWIMPLLAAPGGWRGAFWATSAAMLTITLLWQRARQVPPVERRGSMRDAAGCPNCWLTALQHAAGFGLVLAAGSWIAIYILREFSLPLELSGFLGSLLLFLAMVSRPVGGFLVARERVRTLTVMRSAQLLVLVGLALLALPGRPLAAALAGALAVGFGGGIPYAAVFNTASASFPRAPGAAQGITAVGGLVSTLLGAPAMGYAIQTWGFSAAWGILALISVAALAATFVMRGEEELALG